MHLVLKYSFFLLTIYIHFFEAHLFDSIKVSLELKIILDCKLETDIQTF